MPDKVDEALAGTLKAGTAKNKVIITVKPGYRATIRKALEGHGNKIKREHGSLNLLVTELDSATVLALAKNPMIKALSLDGPMSAHQLGPVVTVSPTIVVPGGVITVTIANGPGNPTDWVSLSSATAGDYSYLSWQYLNGSTTAPVLGLSTATLQF